MKKEVRILKALANEKRLEILELLRTKKKLSSSDLSCQIDLHFKSTSKHLQILANVGLIKSNRNSRWMIHNINNETQKILDIIKKIS